MGLAKRARASVRPVDYPQEVRQLDVRSVLREQSRSPQPAVATALAHSISTISCG